jgi:hypothetical protein
MRLTARNKSRENAFLSNVFLTTSLIRINKLEVKMKLSTLKIYVML